MAQSAAAYELPQILEPQAAGPNLRAIPGKGLGVRSATKLAPWLRTLIVMSAVFLAVLATTCVTRIAVSNLTVQLMLQAELTSEQIANSRAAGAELEVKHSLATNPNRIQDAATARGIVPGNQADTVQARHGFSAETQNAMAAAVAEQVAQATAEAEAAKAAETEAAVAEAAEAETGMQATAAEQVAQAVAEAEVDVGN
jgi:hypothetical protein